jgi:hypothetical protein
MFLVENFSTLLIPETDQFLPPKTLHSTDISSFFVHVQNLEFKKE